MKWWIVSLPVHRRPPTASCSIPGARCTGPSSPGSPPCPAPARSSPRWPGSCSRCPRPLAAPHTGTPGHNGGLQLSHRWTLIPVKRFKRTFRLVHVERFGKDIQFWTCASTLSTLLSTGYLFDIIMVTSSWWYHSWWYHSWWPWKIPGNCLNIDQN